MPAAIAAVAVLLIGGFFITRGGDSKSAGGEIFLEAVADPGPDPFTASVAAPPPPSPTQPASTPAPTPSAPATSASDVAPAIQATSGSSPGLYQGTRKRSSCDRAQLTTLLQQDPAKVTAFTTIVGIAAPDIVGYLSKLTPVTLRGDTRVTNHGFANGKATPRQSVLQAGSAVLVDDRGVPRVRCASGNPLAPPAAVQSKPSYTGPAWPSFDPAAVDVIAPSPQPLSELVLSDPSTNTSFTRPIGTDGAADGPPRPPVLDPTPAPTTTAAPPPPTPTTGAPTTIEQTIDVPLPNADATREGTTEASTTFSPEFPAALAVDGDPTTSWFSSGPDAAGTSVYTWTGAQDDLITRVRLVGNAAHTKAEFRTGFGFASVTVEVLDEFGDPDYSETVQLPGTPDPDVVVRPGVEGRIVRLTFRGHEDPSCGGISELEIGVTR